MGSPVKAPAYRSEAGGAVCDRCARCLEVCPTYLATRVETLSARGRLDLIAGAASGELKAGERYRQALAQCIQCRACSASCPKGVDAAEAVLEERTRRPPKGLRYSLTRLVFRAMLFHRPTTAAVIRILAPLQRWLPAREGATSRHLPFFVADLLTRRPVPRPASQSLFSRFPHRVPPDPGVDPAGRVTFFTGCYHALVEPAPAAAVIRVLAANGFTVSIPPEQTCCGAPAFFSGSREEASRMVERNLQVIGADHSPVVVSCATCGSMIRREYPRLAANPAHGAAFGARVQDVVEILDKLPRLRPGTHPIAPRVTVHDPCHLKRGQGVDRQTRRILEAIPGLEVVEMEDSDLCCGGGGLYSITHPSLSRSMGEAKAQRILDTGADAVAAGCPGCILQIRASLTRTGSRMEVLHPVELLARSYGLK